MHYNVCKQKGDTKPPAETWEEGQAKPHPNRAWARTEAGKKSRARTNARAEFNRRNPPPVEPPTREALLSSILVSEDFPFRLKRNYVSQHQYGVLAFLTVIDHVAAELSGTRSSVQADNPEGRGGKFVDYLVRGTREEAMEEPDPEFREKIHRRLVTWKQKIANNNNIGLAALQPWTDLVRYHELMEAYHHDLDEWKNERDNYVNIRMGAYRPRPRLTPPERTETVPIIDLTSPSPVAQFRHTTEDDSVSVDSGDRESVGSGCYEDDQQMKVGQEEYDSVHSFSSMSSAGMKIGGREASTETPPRGYRSLVVGRSAKSGGHGGYGSAIRNGHRRPTTPKYDHPPPTTLKQPVAGRESSAARVGRRSGVEGTKSNDAGKRRKQPPISTMAMSDATAKRRKQPPISAMAGVSLPPSPGIASPESSNPTRRRPVSSRQHSVSLPQHQEQEVSTQRGVAQDMGEQSSPTRRRPVSSRQHSDSSPQHQEQEVSTQRGVAQDMGEQSSPTRRRPVSSRQHSDSSPQHQEQEVSTQRGVAQDMGEQSSPTRWRPVSSRQHSDSSPQHQEQEVSTQRGIAQDMGEQSRTARKRHEEPASRPALDNPYSAKKRPRRNVKNNPEPEAPPTKQELLSSILCSADFPFQLEQNYVLEHQEGVLAFLVVIEHIAEKFSGKATGVTADDPEGQGGRFVEYLIRGTRESAMEVPDHKFRRKIHGKLMAWKQQISSGSRIGLSAMHPWRMLVQHYEYMETYEQAVEEWRNEMENYVQLKMQSYRPRPKMRSPDRANPVPIIDRTGPSPVARWQRLTVDEGYGSESETSVSYFGTSQPRKKKKETELVVGGEEGDSDHSFSSMSFTGMKVGDGNKNASGDTPPRDYGYLEDNRPNKRGSPGTEEVNDGGCGSSEDETASEKRSDRAVAKRHGNQRRPTTPTQLVRGRPATRGTSTTKVGKQKAKEVNDGECGSSEDETASGRRSDREAAKHHGNQRWPTTPKQPVRGRPATRGTSATKVGKQKAELDEAAHAVATPKRKQPPEATMADVASPQDTVNTMPDSSNSKRRCLGSSQPKKHSTVAEQKQPPVSTNWATRSTVEKKRNSAAMNPDDRTSSTKTTLPPWPASENESVKDLRKKKQKGASPESLTVKEKAKKLLITYDEPESPIKQEASEEKMVQNDDASKNGVGPPFLVKSGNGQDLKDIESNEPKLLDGGSNEVTPTAALKQSVSVMQPKQYSNSHHANRGKKLRQQGYSFSSVGLSTYEDSPGAEPVGGGNSLTVSVLPVEDDLQPTSNSDVTDNPETIQPVQDPTADSLVVNATLVDKEEERTRVLQEASWAHATPLEEGIETRSRVWMFVAGLVILLAIAIGVAFGVRGRSDGNAVDATPSLETAHGEKPTFELTSQAAITKISNGEKINFSYLLKGHYQPFLLEEIQGGDIISCAMEGESGDADLFLRFGEEPFLGNNFVDSAANACHSSSATAMKTCENILASSDALLYVAIITYTEVFQLTLQCNITSADETVLPSPTETPDGLQAFCDHIQGVYDGYPCFCIESEAIVGITCDLGPIEPYSQHYLAFWYDTARNSGFYAFECFCRSSFCGDADAFCLGVSLVVPECYVTLKVGSEVAPACLSECSTCNNGEAYGANVDACDDFTIPFNQGCYVTRILGEVSPTFVPG
ncbi:hypothetical protein IV203_030274 [Nitzschia inconspicua]|uniref:Uncharacterized protein n=1 Tax=Nitzschia inconspicua TaxID=303405 RepID=A0A9K3Q1L6_9STRA|nr:hypothetical protein IV203_030274 [Nitzschia inconspicua]